MYEFSYPKKRVFSVIVLKLGFPVREKQYPQTVNISEPFFSVLHYTFRQQKSHPPNFCPFREWLNKTIIYAKNSIPPAINQTQKGKK